MPSSSNSSSSNPRPGFRRRSLTGAALAAAAAALVCAAAVPAAAAGTPHAPALVPGQFHGVNWADQRDNFADDALLLSGLSPTDDYRTTFHKATRIIAAFRANLGANTVRIPVNPYTVNAGYWNSYRAVFDAATAQGFNVVAAYWEGTGAQKDGRIDDTAQFWRMWSTLTRTYAHNPQVYFEPMNEPFGYTPAEWADIAAQWLQTFPAVPRDRVFVSGSGYNDNVTSVCADSRLDGTYLSLHHYGYWGTHTYAEWLADFKVRVGGCAPRTVVDEFGASMTTGLDYDQPAAGNNEVAFMQADTDAIRALHMGAVYWPGLRTDDTYSLETLIGTADRPWLATTNQSGADRLAWAWGRGKPALEDPVTG
ncbi:glycoside hydrolase family 5 protein [Streptacidiphilus carbonis]|uniref:glycoside hydrolase family 5 protein n=1 Tax=Streptacidiphilus carbonis TaxID=105422 RepID=UPI000693613E|nr:cellulase family glycosylhydrolase [Streptacidiphilus carbonis]